MASMPPPEREGGGGGFLADQSYSPPFSPSVFLDLPPTPHRTKDDGLDLSFISRILMEDDIDGKFFCDHPALLQSQQRQYAQALLSDDSAGNIKNSTTPSSADGDGTNDSITCPYDHPTGDGTSNILFLPGSGGGGGPSSIGFQENPAPFDGAGDDGQNGAIIFFSNDAAEEEAERAAFTVGHGPSFSGGRADGGMDIVKAFLKGMADASKFLPTNNALLVDVQATSGQFLPRHDKRGGFTGGGVRKEKVLVGGTMSMLGNGRGRKNRHDADALAVETGRSRKLMHPDREEPGARELHDEMMLNEYDLCMKEMEDLRVAIGAEKKSRKSGRVEAVEMHNMLIRCAQLVAMDDRRSAAEMLRQIKQHSSPRGDATERLGHYFAEGLEARLAGTGSEMYRSIVARGCSVVSDLKAHRLFMAACSFREVTFAFSSKTIHDAVAGKSRLHIVDYGVQYGLHWAALLKGLAAREGGPPEVRITGIDLPEPGFLPACQIEETGRRLSNCAREFGVPFKYRGIAAKWETVHAEDLNLDPDEVLVVSAQSGFGYLMDESVFMDRQNPRDVVVGNIRKMRPDVYIECIFNGTYGAPFFVTRFREAMFFYSMHFDMMDATIPRDNDERLLIEQRLFGKWVLNIIACEGADRVDRPETYRQWQVRNHRAGLRQLPLNPEAVNLVTDMVKNHYHKDFLIYADRGWVLQGWKGRIFWAVSTWVAED